MSNQGQQQRQQQPRRIQNPPPDSRSSQNEINNPRDNLYLDFSQSFETHYNCVEGIRRPIQSGFVSSTSWTPNDSTWYKAQTIYAPSKIITGPTQDPKITNSQKDADNHFLRELLDDRL